LNRTTAKRHCKQLPAKFLPGLSIATACYANKESRNKYSIYMQPHVVSAYYGRSSPTIFIYIEAKHSCAHVGSSTGILRSEDAS
jgi:hypothetical protein